MGPKFSFGFKPENSYNPEFGQTGIRPLQEKIQGTEAWFRINRKNRIPVNPDSVHFTFIIEEAYCLAPTHKKI